MFNHIINEGIRAFIPFVPVATTPDKAPVNAKTVPVKIAPPHTPDVHRPRTLEQRNRRQRRLANRR